MIFTLSALVVSICSIYALSYGLYLWRLTQKLSALGVFLIACIGWFIPLISLWRSLQ